jgi:hypothetical protein
MAVNAFSGGGPFNLPPSPYINMPYLPMPTPYPYPPFHNPGYPIPSYYQFPPYAPPYRPMPFLPPMMSPPIFIAPGLPYTGWWIPREYFPNGDPDTKSQGLGFGQNQFIA